MKHNERVHFEGIKTEFKSMGIYVRQGCCCMFPAAFNINGDILVEEENMNN